MQHPVLLEMRDCIQKRLIYRMVLLRERERERERYDGGELCFVTQSATTSKSVSTWHTEWIYNSMHKQYKTTGNK